jgi:hypothetical protein
MNRPAQFDVTFRPNAELVPVIRCFVSSFYDHVVCDADVVARVALATHELLENAVKYSSDGSTSLSIAVEPRDAEILVRIRISNPATADHIALVRSFFEEVREHEDPFEHYQVAMRRSATRTTGSGLGLVRVRAEGEMRMSHEVCGDCVSIVAEARVSGGLS